MGRSQQGNGKEEGSDRTELKRSKLTFCIHVGVLKFVTNEKKRCPL